MGSAGEDRIPPGPVIFACAPHANQFVDPIVVQSKAGREVSYLIAAASLRRPFIGRVARTLNAIGVERPQDISTAGVGSFVCKGVKVTGEGTNFLKQVRPGDTLSIVSKNGAKFSGNVKSVQSNTSIELKKDITNEEGVSIELFEA